MDDEKKGAKATITFDEKGNPLVEVDRLRKIGLGNILDVRTHVIMREGELTVHKIEFHDGGATRLEYTSDGKLRKFEGFNISWTITKDHDLIINAA